MQTAHHSKSVKWAMCGSGGWCGLFNLYLIAGVSTGMAAWAASHKRGASQAGAKLEHSWHAVFTFFGGSCIENNNVWQYGPQNLCAMHFKVLG
jgi:hypothetical protein